MATASTRARTGLYTKVCGRTTFSVGKAMRNGQMVARTWGIIQTVRSME